MQSQYKIIQPHANANATAMQAQCNPINAPGSPDTSTLRNALRTVSTCVCTNAWAASSGHPSNINSFNCRVCSRLAHNYTYTHI